MRRAGIALLAFAAVGVVLTGCGGDDADPGTSPTEPAPEQTSTAEAPTPTADAPPGDSEVEPDDGAGESSAGDQGPQLSPDERAAVHTVREYVRALDRRDGEAACALLVPGAIDAVELPRERGSCAASLSASIGYRDPRGLPVWEGARVAEIVSIERDEEAAKVVATTVTEFSDRDELSIEDDVVYLERSGEGWLVAKPSSTLYRAVGLADVPPSVLSPPS